ncbi:MAG: hypothetical protein QME60_00835 [Verrucomicrobiota bacterium]|nr:hypothetical protein [Verrucomicrobiota bacterium]
MTGIRATVFLALQSALGSRAAQYYREFLRLDCGSPDALRDLRSRRLEGVLRDAVRNCPFYRERVRGSRSPVLEDFPILAKSDIRDNFLNLVSDGKRAEVAGGRPRSPGYSWIEVRTGGTTGMPIRVIHDAGFRDQGRASRLYSQRLCGFPFGAPYFRLWGSMEEVRKMRRAWPARLTGWLAREHLLNAFEMNHARQRRYIGLINERVDVDYLMAYVDAACQLASHAQAENMRVRPLAAIMACAGTVTLEARSLLSEVFSARVHNKYGSRECADMACECEDGGFHVYAHQAHLEVVDEQGNRVPAGQSGRILVTLLGNSTFPLVRYEIGDRGALRDGLCPCGRPFPLLETVEGRTVQFLEVSGGRYVSPVYIRHLIGVVHGASGVRRFQLRRVGTAQFDLLVVLDDSAGDGVFAKFAPAIVRDLQAAFGAEAQISTRRVAEIPPAPSGKHLYVVDELKQTP